MKELILGELTERKIGYGIVQPGESTIGGVPVIKVNNIISGLKSILDLDTTHPENDQKYRKTRLNGGEIIISVVGTIGKTVIVPMDFKGCNLVRATALIDIKDPILSRWVKYYIDSPKGQSYINGNLNTTVQPTLNIKSLVEMPIPFYGREYAEKVVTILSKIDDKIENNRRINDNLEQQAQALYKSWFVDFEPFKDQEFVDSEIGLIPENWNCTTLSEFISIKYGKDHKKLADGIIPVFGSGGLMRHVDTKLHEGESVLIPRKGSLNNVMYVNEAFWTVDTMFYSTPKVENSCIYAYLFLANKDLASMNAGSAVPSMTTDILNNMPIIAPPTEVLKQFNNICNVYFSRIHQNNIENANLAKQRDTLLPKLMSGGLKINKIDC